MSDSGDTDPVEPAATGPASAEPPATAPAAAEPGAANDDATSTGSPDRDPTAGRGAAALAVTAALASLSTGMAMVAILQGGTPSSHTGDWAISVAFATAAVFGPAALAALLGAQALVRHRLWAPLLLLVVGTVVVTAGLVILTVTVSRLTGGENGPYSELHFIFDQSADEALVLIAVLAALHALTGTLEAAAGIMGRHAVQPGRAAR